MLQGHHTTDSDNVLVALGGNAASTAGDARATVLAALDRLREVFPKLAASRLYRTPAFPKGAGPDFVNAACTFQSDLDPADILTRLHGIEADFGRERTLRWGQRTLDLDLIAVGQEIRPDLACFSHWHALPPEKQAEQAPDRLVLPHPRLQNRLFVLVPLAEIAPDWCHPVLGQTVVQMRDALPTSDMEDITALK